MQARGERIRRQRVGSGYGLRTFAKKIGISPSWLSRIERDENANPSPDLLRRIALELEREAPARAAINKIAQNEEDEGPDEDPPDE
ncbi:helix-turn-helix transcriptional regulator [Streptomyces sp. NPDC019937]|uniref:helix-turn-helix domain-containing protein n=1 Tax=Streptomyces sp. NPDC019937 TaxID=3154787 RepID=UPI00340E76AE